MSAIGEGRAIFEALGNLGDFLGGIGVVVTLIYLSIQIRQNTNAIRTASRQDIAAGYRDVTGMLLDMQVATAFAKGLNSYPDLPFEERARFGIYINQEALFHQGAYALYESEQLDERTYFAYRDWFACIIATPGGRVWWEDVARPIFEPRMVAAIDERMAAGGLLDPRQLYHLRLDESPMP